MSAVTNLFLKFRDVVSRVCSDEKADRDCARSPGEWRDPLRPRFDSSADIGGLDRPRQAEAALGSCEEKYRKLYDNIREGVVSIALDGRITECNQALREMLGYATEEILRLSYEDIVPQERYSQAWDGMRDQVLTRGYSEPYEMELTRRDNSILPVEVRSYLIGNEEGAASGIWTFVTNISERRRMEGELKRTKDHLENVIENAVDAIGIVDADGAFTIWNKRSETIFGYTVGEIKGSHYSKLYADKAEMTKLLSLLKRDGVVREYEASMRKKNGEIVPMELSINLLRNEEGKVVGSISVARDLRDKKLLEAQLLHAVKMEAVGTLAGGIAHDFNNLLQAIQGYAELLSFDKDKNDPQYFELQEIVRAARRGGELTKQLLTFSRKVESKLRPVNLNQEVNQIARLLERTIPKMIKIEVSCDPALRPVNGDPTQLEQILMNLGVNAKDAMPYGGNLVIETKNASLDDEYCRLHPEATPGEYVLLTVTDTGHGIERAAMGHIFDPFYTTKEVGRGSGLGLSMVYGIVRNHGGSIDCWSEPGKGTSFRIYLPVIKATVEPSNSLAIENFPSGSERILVVDDEEFVRNVAEQILTRYGYRVVTAPDGEGALELFRSGEGFDLTILDLVMPGMGGTECLEKLLEMSPGARVIIASGYSSDTAQMNALKSKARYLIDKPYRVRDMLQAVRKVLDEEGSLKDEAGGASQ
jgi:two-component system cell cycle sensor histidine kinase/response regulator CckA